MDSCVLVRGLTVKTTKGTLVCRRSAGHTVAREVNKLLSKLILFAECLKNLVFADELLLLATTTAVLSLKQAMHVYVLAG